MLESIRGLLRAREPAVAVVETGGLCFRVQIPLSTYEALPRPGEVASLLLHLVVREEEWRLFGFGTSAERDSFRALLRVSGVGPVLALGLLSALAPEDLRTAIGRGDLAVLTRVKGVGRKTAERIVVELRHLFEAGAGLGTSPLPLVEDAVRALIQLGTEPAAARRKVEAAHQDLGEADPGLAVLVRTALNR